MKLKIYFITILFFIAFNLKANDGHFSIGPQGGTLYPENNEHIEMLEEEVVYDQASGEFVTTFYFRNTSDIAQTVIIGFPVEPPDDSDWEWEGEYPSDAQLIEKIKKQMSFKTWVDGKEISRELWKIAPGNRYNFAFITTVKFKPGQKIKIINKFNQGFGYGGDNMGGSNSHIKYILKTGAWWKGNIGKAKITFKLTDEESFREENGIENGGALFAWHKHWTSSIVPTKLDTVNNMITWEFNDFEPDFDIELDFFTDKGVLFATNFIENIDSVSKYILLKDDKGFENQFEVLKKEINQSMYASNLEKELFQNLYIDVSEYFMKKRGEIDSFVIHYQVRHIINFFAALNNYEFSDERWTRVFSLFDWYTPNTKTPKYSDEVQEIIERVLAFEKNKDYWVAVIKDSPNSSLPDSALTENSNSSTNQSNSHQLIYYIGLFVFIVLGIVVFFVVKNRKKKN